LRLPARERTSEMVLRPLAVFTALLGVVSGCGSSEVGQPSPPPVDPRIYQQATVRAAGPQKSTFERERDSLDAFGNALVQNDTKALSTLLDPDADFSFPGMSDASDREGLLKALSDLFGAFSSKKYVPTRIWQSGEAAIAEWTMQAVQSGDWLTVKGTGKPVAIKGLSVYFFNLNGLINDVHVYFDAGAVLAQVGAAPKGVEPGAPPALPSAPLVVVAGGTPEEKANVLTVNASWDAFEAKHEAGYLAPMADDIDVYRLDRIAPEHGKDHRRKFFKWMTNGLSSLAQTPLNAWGIGPFVVEEYTITGVHSGKLTNNPPSGHAVRIHLVDVSELSGGKIVRTWSYGNSLELLAEIGEAERASPGLASAVVH
jgi:predicted ester cyclase